MNWACQPPLPVVFTAADPIPQSHCAFHLLSDLYPLRVPLPHDRPLVVILFKLQQFVDAPVEFKYTVQDESAVPLWWGGHGRISMGSRSGQK